VNKLRDSLASLQDALHLDDLRNFGLKAVQKQPLFADREYRGHYLDQELPKPSVYNHVEEVRG